MEFDMKDLHTILMNLFDENSIQAGKSNANNVCKTEPIEASGFTQQEKSSTAKTTPTTYIADFKCQQYCLVIFNNPKWSEILHRKSANIPTQMDQQQVQQQTLQPKIDRSVQSLVKNEKQDRSLDDQFIAQLRQLIKEYIKHTTRPLPLKYFLDLTEQ
ncbi:unnamed protein product [Rotaria sordida]|uniref:Uncharacterized protein n=1 Tax=Rotaria sordida TaxID=392033 RepID=A0A819QPN7_9BILA|nr:unnamed protein product [Rotaria sordida]CAF1392023.1 unnamed protein product [Rotaria sordida]CAF4032169.1 unnamed protein product [Rotaria sordida]